MVENPVVSEPPVRLTLDEITEIRMLRKEIEKLRKRVIELERKYELPEAAVIELRDIPREQAKNEIMKLYKDKKYHDAGEVADELMLDIRTVVEVCNELITEGVIGE